MHHVLEECNQWYYTVYHGLRARYKEEAEKQT